MPAAADPVAMLNVDEPPELTDAGLNDTVDPAGAPVADSATVCADPEVTAVLIIAEVEPPCTTEPLDGLELIEKSLVTVLPPGTVMASMSGASAEGLEN